MTGLGYQCRFLGGHSSLPTIVYKNFLHVYDHTESSFPASPSLVVELLALLCFLPFPFRCIVWPHWAAHFGNRRDFPRLRFGQSPSPVWLGVFSSLSTRAWIPLREHFAIALPALHRRIVSEPKWPFSVSSGGSARQCSVLLTP